MPEIYKLDLNQLVKALGLHDQFVRELSNDGIIPVLDVTRFVTGALTTPAPSPTPLAGLGIQDRFAFRAGLTSVALSTTITGVLKVFGGALISGTDLAGKSFSHTTPPTADYYLWGVTSFLGMAASAGAQGEIGFIVQRSSGAGGSENEIFADAVDWHADGILPTVRTTWFTRPFLIAAGADIFFNYTFKNTSAAQANSYDANVRLWWEYA